MKRTIQWMTAIFAAAMLTACATDRGYDDDRYEARATSNYGYVENVRQVAVEDEGIGFGAVIGAVAGGVLGSQVGSGTGKDVATVAGAVAGGMAGHEIEKRRGGDTDLAWQFMVELDDGRMARVVQRDSYGIDVGDRVRLEGEEIHPIG